MICNEHYGGRNDLPFDLAHKAGPIFYRLAPDASRQQRTAVKTQFAAILKEALQPLLALKAPTQLPPVDLTPPGANDGVFYHVGESLGQHGDPGFGDPVEDFFCAVSPILYLKIVPTSPLEQRLLRSEVASAARSLPFFSRTGGSFEKTNRWGSACLEPLGHSNEVQSVAQLTLKGEFWGINSNLLRTFSEELLVIGAMEALLQRRLPEYARLLNGQLRVSLPMSVEIGVRGVKGRKVLLGRNTTAGIVYQDNPAPSKALLVGLDTTQMQSALLELFSGLFLALLDEVRPENFRRFPHPERHADYGDW